jgi:hypothetical protein
MLTETDHQQCRAAHAVRLSAAAVDRRALQVRRAEKDGNKCLVKTIDNPFFQRAMVFMGTPDLKNYTIEADVMSDGNKRKMSTVGVINQRYRITLKGNEQCWKSPPTRNCSTSRCLSLGAQ